MMIIQEQPELEYVLRLVIAGVLGGLVGAEREYRSKEAGMRTHFLVALGSSLIMMVSQHGFSDVAGIAWIKLDPSRVAAQIVSGIGFLGAGLIIFHKQAVKGLTTAAGVWVAAGIGMAVGGGMYILGAVATLFTLAGFEMLRFSSLHLGLVNRTTRVSFSAKSAQASNRTVSSIRKLGCRVGGFSFRNESSGGIKVSMLVRYRVRDPENDPVIRALEKIPEVKIESLE